MIKLILYSDQIAGSNKQIDEKIFELTGKNNPKIGYIPSCSDLKRKYFNPIKDYYENMGIDNLLYFDLDEEYDESNLEELFTCDAIHLSGGNTFYFLSILKMRNFIELLKDYVLNGGVLIGISAGSILMTDTIESAGYGDEDIVGSSDKKALGLVDFEFFPHWNLDSEYLDELLEYSKRKGNVIYLCNDGDGIIVNGNDIEFIGEIKKIEDGVLTSI